MRYGRYYIYYPSSNKQKGLIQVNLPKRKRQSLDLLRKFGIGFLELPINHPMEMNEMAIKIHDIQRMIISRPGFRLNQEMFKGYGKGNSDKG